MVVNISSFFLFFRNNSYSQNEMQSFYIFILVPFCHFNIFDKGSLDFKGSLDEWSQKHDPALFTNIGSKSKEHTKRGFANQITSLYSIFNMIVNLIDFDFDFFFPAIC